MDILLKCKRARRYKKLRALRQLRDKCLSKDGCSDDLAGFGVVKKFSGGLPLIMSHYHGGCAKYYMWVSTKKGRMTEYGIDKWKCFDKLVLRLYKYESKRMRDEV